MKFASRKAIYKLFLWIVTILVSLIFLVPLYWILISSLTDPNELFSSPINYFPSNLTFNNYIRLFVNLNIGQKTINTLIISAAAIVISTITCLMAAYAFSTSSRTNIIRKLIVSKMHETQMPFSA